jgi:hypothetical protein
MPLIAINYLTCPGGVTTVALGLEMGPRGEVRQAPWSVEMLRDYYAPASPE